MIFVEKNRIIIEIHDDQLKHFEAIGYKKSDRVSKVEKAKEVKTPKAIKVDKDSAGEKE
ncbi:MAG: hypothetical protein PHQ32_02425 [Firmicutes bacterium]|nr:hypothetical protein [Bacillota bacterium]